MYAHSNPFRDFVGANDMGKNYPHKRRVCAIVDCRESDGETDKLTFFEPPQNCCSFPEHKEGHVQLWHFDASRACILPDEGYNQGKHKDRARALTSATASAMTLSFHVESADEIRCYLFVEGGVMRFLPQDIIEVVPRFFDPEFGDNARWVSRHGGRKANMLVKQMSRQLCDKKFNAFYKACFD